MKGLWRHLRRSSDERGQDVVEFAATLPLLLLLLMGIMEFSIVMLSYNTVASATREGARRGVIYNASEGEIIDAVLNLTPGVGLTANNVVVRLGKEKVEVEATYDVRLITGFMIRAVGGSGTIRLRTSSTMRRE